MKNRLFTALFSLLLQCAAAQNGEEAFTFLRFPASARINALGGNHISLVERDPALIFHNPAALGAEMDGMINLNYMNYISDINTGSALFTKAWGEKSAWGVGAGFISYGNFKQTTADRFIEGEFSVKDISLNAFYSRELSDRWRGGLAIKLLYSSLERYTSIGLAVDAGLSYYNSQNGFSAGIVLKHIGAQLKAYDDARQKMPWDIQLGMSKKMAYAPFRLSLTAMYLNRWTFDSGETFFQSLAKHAVIGVDFIPTENVWLGIGFNPKTNQDMKLQGGNALAGFSAGAGITVKKFDVGVSIAKYHPAAMSLMVSVSTALTH
ncbi:MAG: type IX secretion system protein PorQ [Tannerellaceae bacterium]|jgi:hypothetical protein|nr:type IX secretion system protein PorQ [Tannerellaceae bacterium]